MAVKLEKVMEKTNSLLKRKELEFIADHSLSGTPNRAEIKKKIAAMLNQGLSLVFIKKVVTLSGENKSKVTVHVYENKDIAEKIEPDYIIKRNEIKEEKPEVKEETNQDEQKEETQ